MRPFIAALIAISLAAGCSFGPSKANLRVATSPLGAAVQLSTKTARVNGELLAVNDSGLVLLDGRRMMTVPFTEIRDAKFAELGAQYRIRGGRRPPPLAIARLRRVSHFPQGITPEIQAKLLTLYEQQRQ